jgi:hypothetical protein
MEKEYGKIKGGIDPIKNQFLHNFSAIDIDMFLFDKIVMPFLQHYPNSSPTNISSYFLMLQA